MNFAPILFPSKVDTENPTSAYINYQINKKVKSNAEQKNSDNYRVRQRKRLKNVSIHC